MYPSVTRKCSGVIVNLRIGYWPFNPVQTIFQFHNVLVIRIAVAKGLRSNLICCMVMIMSWCQMHCGSGRDDWITWYFISMCAVSFWGFLSNAVNRKLMLMDLNLQQLAEGMQRLPEKTCHWCFDFVDLGHSQFIGAFKIVYIPTYCWVLAVFD